jgi:hypothetical protein
MSERSEQASERREQASERRERIIRHVVPVRSTGSLIRTPPQAVAR